MTKSLEVSLYESEEIVMRLKNKNFAKKLYGALCNNGWYFREPYTSDEDRVIQKLKNGPVDPWSISWRGAGGLIAEIRNDAHGKDETYMDFYLSGNEGTVDQDVEELLASVGWYTTP